MTRPILLLAITLLLSGCQTNWFFPAWAANERPPVQTAKAPGK